MPKIVVLLKLTITLLALSISQHSAGREIDNLNCKRWAREFFIKPTTVQMVEFSKFPLDSQYEIYICGIQTRHPPSIHLAIPFAKAGEPAVFLLRDKLVATDDDRTIRDILVAFSQISIQRTYDYTVKYWS